MADIDRIRDKNSTFTDFMKMNYALLTGLFLATGLMAQTNVTPPAAPAPVLTAPAVPAPAPVARRRKLRRVLVIESSSKVSGIPGEGMFAPLCSL